jgi:hypothetical protein
MVVMTFVEGERPETEADWRRVAETLRRLHRLTKGLSQRPGWRSSTDLLNAETGTKVDLRAMPPEGVARCRTAWARFVGRPTCVVHGNPTNPGNVRGLCSSRVAKRAVRQREWAGLGSNNRVDTVTVDSTLNAGCRSSPTSII